MAIFFKVDESIKLIKAGFTGTASAEEMKELKEMFEQQVRKIKPEEWKLLNDASEMKVMSAEAAEAMKEIQVLFKDFYKVASVTPSILAQTQAKKASSEVNVTNRRFFSNVEEAIKWLMG